MEGIGRSVRSKAISFIRQVQFPDWGKSLQKV
jgi:hypothetical protein